MTRVARSRFGILGILLIGGLIGYMIASTNAPTLPSADATEAKTQKENQPDAKPALRGAKADAMPDRRKTYYPNTEELGPTEMRVISLGTGMPNQRKSQASACWLVELGNGEKFLFDLGTGSVSNLSMLEIPYDLVNKVFVGHLHSDHVGDFAAWHIGGWVAYHFFNDTDTWQDMYDEIRTTYDGPLSLAKDMMVWNVTDEGVKVRDVVAQEAVWPAKSPYGTVPPSGDREELPPWLVDGIVEMEDVIKAYYERQGVGDLYEQQIPKK